MTLFPDTHTHTVRVLPRAFDLLNVELPFAGQLDKLRSYSIGVHPWSDPAGWDAGLKQLEHLITLPQVRAVGECGLDKRRGAPLEQQKELFIRQIVLAVEHKKPLILHNYKAADEMLELHAKYGGTWILHGFRANASVMGVFLKRGFYFSYGSHFNEEALLKTPLDRLLLETDEASEAELIDLYGRVSVLLAMDTACLAGLMKKNMGRLFSM